MILSQLLYLSTDEYVAGDCHQPYDGPAFPEDSDDGRKTVWSNSRHF